ncbi:MAG: Ig-like domain-containing protein [Panacagrimonas sp.]
MRGSSSIGAIATAALALCLLSACDGSKQAETSSPGQARPAQGAAIKGPLQGASVRLFTLDDGGFATGEPVAELSTDDNGRFSFERPSGGAALLAQTFGGSYVDESDPETDPAERRRVVLNGEQGFESVLPAEASTLVITPYTHAMLLRARRLADGADFSQIFEAVRVRSAEAFGFDPTAVLPEAPLNPAPSASDEALEYALLLGGASHAINELSFRLGTFPSYATVRAFIDDFADGITDGLLDGSPVTVDIGDGATRPIPPDIDLATQTLRFRNNHFNLYGTRLAAIDENRLSQPIVIGNRRPLARDDAAATTQDTPLSLPAPGVLANDLDNDGDALTARLVDGPANGSVTLDADGSFVYSPAPGFVGADLFTYVANDATADSVPATVFITVADDPNLPPLAVADTLSVAEGGIATTLDDGASSVLANDTDPNDDPLSARLVTQPLNGTLTFNPDGSFGYTHDGGETTADRFSYQASDGTSLSEVVEVGIAVTPVNDAPTAIADSFAVESSTFLNVAASGLLANDLDVENSTLSAILVSAPANGTLNLNADGSFSYISREGFGGADSFTYRASDGSDESNIAIVSITVGAPNLPPVAVADSFAALQDTRLRVPRPGVLLNDSDPESASIFATLLAGPANGTLTLARNGAFTYVPAPEFNGTDTFTYTASDGVSDSAPVTVTLVVDASNRAPLAGDDAFTTNESTPLIIAAPGLLANDSDPDGDPLILSLVQQPEIGTLVLGTDGGFRYTPREGFSGSDSFSYRLSDGDLDSNLATVSLTVVPVNDPPVAANDVFDTPENTTLTIAAPGVLGNDTDAEQDRLLAELVSEPARGSLDLRGNGGFTYTPDEGFSGTVQFSYRASDGEAVSNTATVTISVNSINDPPVAANDGFTTNEGTTLTVAVPGVLANDADPEGLGLTATLLSGTASGTLDLSANGRFTYRPEANFNGIDRFTYRVSDGALNSNTATVTITVVAVDFPPVAVNDSYTTAEDTALTIPATTGVLANDSDSDEDPLTATQFAGATNGSVSGNANGGFTFTPTPGFVGTASFSYRASDGSAPLSNPATVNITVTAVNDAPVAVNDSFTTAEGSTLTRTAANGVLANDTDPDGPPPTQAVLISSVAPASGTLAFQTNGGFTYTPAANFNGTASFTYRARDAANLNSANIATVNITVTPVNNAPVAVNDSFTTTEGSTLTRTAANGVLANDTDPDGPPPTQAVLVSSVAAASGTLEFLTNGGFTYSPAANFNGTATFTYRARDAANLNSANIATVNITVTAVNTAPVAVNDSFTTAEGSTLTRTAANGVLVNDTDPDGPAPNQAVLVSSVAAASGTLEFLTNGGFTYSPAANFNGTATFTYRARDAANLNSANIATVNITVTAVNSAPNAVNDAFNTTEDVAGGFTRTAANGVLANDTDPDGAPPTQAVLVSSVAAAAGTLNFQNNGGFTYNPAANFSGTATFTYRARDAQNLNSANIATANIVVAAQNDAPVAVADDYSTDDDQTLTVVNGAGDLLDNDSDPDGPSPLTAVGFSALNPANAGTLSTNANGSFTFVPNGSVTGDVTFTYRARDGANAQSANTTVTITVIDTNDPPVAMADANFLTVAEGGMDSTGSASVLDNDSDPDGDSLTAVLVSGPARDAAFNLAADGSFTYTHDGSETTSDSFTYRVSASGDLSNTVTVGITITGVNDPPEPDNNLGLTVLEGGNGAISMARLRFSDPDSPASDVIYCFSGNAEGTVQKPSNNDAVSFTQAQVNANQVLYQHAGSEAPNDSFSGDVRDDGTCAGAPPPGSPNFSFNIDVTPVNDPPVASNDNYSTPEDQDLIVDAPSGILVNDNDGGDGPAMLSSGNYTAPPPGTGTLTIMGDGSFMFDPDPNFAGQTSFTYRADDGALSNNLSAVTTVTIMVTPVNDAPSLPVNFTFIAVPENGSRTVTPSVLMASDVEGGPGNLIFEIVGRNGFSALNDDSLTLNGNPVGVGNSFTQADINNGNLAYTDFTGLTGQIDEFEFSLEDSLGLPAVGSPFTLRFRMGGADMLRVGGPPDTGDQLARMLRLGRLSTVDGLSVLSGGADAVAGIGDFNGDGFGDVAVGGANEVRVVFGSATGLPGSLLAPWPLGGTQRAQGFVVRGHAGVAEFGSAVSAAGDVNADGYADLLIGSPFEGAAYLLFGGARPRPAVMTLVAPTRGFVRFQADGPHDRFGNSVSTAGDLNGDGFADVIVGSPLADPRGRTDAGRAHVWLGAPAARLSGAAAAIRLDGAQAGDHAGTAVSAGDLNGDGRADAIIGSPLAGAAGLERSGAIHVVYGASGGLAAVSGSLARLTGENGYTLDGDAAGAQFGTSLATGDVNADGLADAIIGAPFAHKGAGAVHVAYGSVLARPAHSTVSARSGAGLFLRGASGGDNAGHAVASGDVNGDGLADVLIGAPGMRAGVGSGGAYALFGGRSLPSHLMLDRLRTGAGLRILGGTAGDLAGAALGAAPDINGDGRDDLIVGAPGVAAAYLIYGRTAPVPGR